MNCRGDGRLSRSATAFGTEGSEGWKVNVIALITEIKACLAVRSSIRASALCLDCTFRSVTKARDQTPCFALLEDCTYGLRTSSFGRVEPMLCISDRNSVDRPF
jgi:hypothetical protein